MTLNFGGELATALSRIWSWSPVGQQNKNQYQQSEHWQYQYNWQQNKNQYAHHCIDSNIYMATKQKLISTISRLTLTISKVWKQELPINCNVTKKAFKWHSNCLVLSADIKVGYSFFQMKKFPLRDLLRTARIIFNQTLVVRRVIDHSSSFAVNWQQILQ